MLDNFNQPKGSTIGVLRDGRTIQEAFDEAAGSLVLSDIRYRKFTALGQEITIGEHTRGQGMGGGTFRVISLTKDDYVDDNGCQVITNDGVVLRRKTHFISSDMFGLIGGGDILACLDNMYKASRSLRIEEVLVCRQTNSLSYRADTSSRSGFVADISDGFGFSIQGLGVGYRGARIDHVGGGVAITIKKDRNVNKDFWATCAIGGLVFSGRNDQWTGDNTTTTATPIRIQDVIGADIHDVFVERYLNNTGGAAISLYNVTGWTEMTKFTNVMVRNSSVVLKLHRDPAGNGGTKSFFGTSGIIEANAGANTPCTFIHIGDGTEAGNCLLYGHDITIRGWMSRSAGHSGVRVTDYSTCVEGKFTFVWDGYGISVGSNEAVINLIRVDGLNGKFDCIVDNISGQEGMTHISLLQQVWDSCIRSSPDAINNSLNNAYPCIRPRGLTMKFGGKFTMESTRGGVTIPLSRILPGMQFMVTINSWNNDKYQLKATKWHVQAMSIDFPCVITPMFGSAVSVAKTSTTVSSPSGDVAALTDVSVTHNDRTQNEGLGEYSLRINNGRPNNSTSYAQNSGLKLFLELPGNAGASEAMAYNVEIEIL